MDLMMVKYLPKVKLMAILMVINLATDWDLLIKIKKDLDLETMMERHLDYNLVKSLGSNLVK